MHCFLYPVVVYNHPPGLLGVVTLGLLSNPATEVGNIIKPAFKSDMTYIWFSFYLFIGPFYYLVLDVSTHIKFVLLW